MAGSRSSRCSGDVRTPPGSVIFSAICRPAWRALDNSVNYEVIGARNDSGRPSSQSQPTAATKRRTLVTRGHRNRNDYSLTRYRVHGFQGYPWEFLSRF